MSGRGSGGNVVVGLACLGLLVLLGRCPIGWLPIGGLLMRGAYV